MVFIIIMTDATKSTLTTKFTDFEANRLTFTDLEENDRSKGQLIAYPRYNHPKLGEGQPLFLQGPWITIFTYGIPTLGEFYSDDTQRAFIKVPLNSEDSDVMKMVEELKKLDDVYGGDEFKQKSFGKKANKYEYQPIIRESQSDDEGNVKPAYLKLKLDTTWPEGLVQTELYKSELVDKKRVRELTPASTVTEVSKMLSYMTKFKPIFRPVKMWAHNAKMANAKYGVVFKLLKAEYEPNVSNNNNISKYMTGDAFIDDDEEEEETSAPKAKSTEDTPTTVFKATEVTEDTKVTKDKKSKKVVAQNSDDSDDSDDSDESSDESSDDSDSEEPPKKVAAAKGKGKGKGKPSKA